MSKSDMALIICSKCKIAKSPDAFIEDVRKKNGKASWCKECNNSRSNKWAKANRQWINTYKLVSTLEKREKGIGPRPKKCEICGNPCSVKENLSWDHHHGTNRGRGWLCFDCNTGIGKLGDNPALLRRAETYLRTRGFHASKSFIG